MQPLQRLSLASQSPAEPPVKFSRPARIRHDALRAAATALGLTAALLPAALLGGCEGNGATPAGTVDGAVERRPGAPWSSERDLLPLATAYQGTVLAYYDAHKERRSFESHADPAHPVTVVFDVFPGTDPTRGAIVVSHGLGESSLKYAEVVFDLHRRGYALYVLNHRGHGFSGRLLADRTLIHVGDFEHYVDDLLRVVDEAVLPSHPSKVFGLGHSMGGGILTRAAERRPEVFTALALNAPMHRMANADAAESYAAWGNPEEGIDVDSLAWLGALFGGGGGSGGTDDSAVTSSAARGEIPAFQVQVAPELLLANITNGWTTTCVAGARRTVAEAARITAPVLILQAEHDGWVDNAAQNEVCQTLRAAGRSCTLQVVAGAHHEILQETDVLRDQAMDAVVAHFER